MGGPGLRRRHRQAGRPAHPQPVAHIDPIGTIVVPALMALSGLGMFGWAKPVPVTVGRLRHPRNQTVCWCPWPARPPTWCWPRVAAVVLHGVRRRRHRDPAGTFGAVWAEVVFYFGLVNIWLAVFNLIPVPPLDGSARLRAAAAPGLVARPTCGSGRTRMPLLLGAAPAQLLPAPRPARLAASTTCSTGGPHCWASEARRPAPLRPGGARRRRTARRVGGGRHLVGPLGPLGQHLADRTGVGRPARRGGPAPGAAARPGPRPRRA